MDYDDDDECENDKYADVRANAQALLEALEDREEKASPLKGVINEARDIVAAYDHKAELTLKLDLINRQHASAHFNDLIDKLGNIAQDSVEDILVNLDARLVKQAQSLDVMHDLFLHLSQYALAQDTKSLQDHVNLALKAQSQSAATIEKFQKLREKRVKNAEQTNKNREQTNRRSRNAPVD